MSVVEPVSTDAICTTCALSRELTNPRTGTCVNEVEVRAVLNGVADEVLAVAGEPESGVRDAINLVVNGALHRLFVNRDAELDEIVALSYSDGVTVAEVVEWITS